MAKKEKTIIEFEGQIKLDSKDAENKLSAVSKKEINIPTKLDTTKLSEQLSKIPERKKLNNKKVKVEAKLDLTKLRDALDKLPTIRALNNKAVTVGVKLDTSGLNSTLEKLKNNITVGIKIDENSVAKALSKLPKQYINVGLKVDSKAIEKEVSKVSSCASKRKKASVDDDEKFRTLRAKRADALVKADKAYQTYGENSVQYRSARKEYMRANTEYAKFGQNTGKLGLNALIKEYENMMSAYSNQKNPVRQTIEKLWQGAIKRQDELAKQLEAKNPLKQLKASEEQATVSRKVQETIDKANEAFRNKGIADQVRNEMALIREEIALLREREAVLKSEQRMRSALAKAEARQQKKDITSDVKNKFTLERESRQGAAVSDAIANLKQGINAGLPTNEVQRLRDELQKATQQYLEFRKQALNFDKNAEAKLLGNIAGKVAFDTTALDDLIKKAQIAKQEYKALQDQIKGSTSTRGGGAGSGSNTGNSAQTFAAEAKRYAAEAEKAWRDAGNRSTPEFEKLRKQFMDTMNQMVRFRREIGDLSAGQAAGVYSKMASSLGKLSPLYDGLIKKARELNKEQARVNQEAKGDRSGGRWFGSFPTYLTHFIGRSSKGWGSFGEAIADAASKLQLMGGALGKFGVALGIGSAVFASIFAAGTLIVKGFTALVQATSTFGNILQQIGTTIYNVLRPGIELYKQQTSAIFSFTAALQSNAKYFEGGEYKNKVGEALSREQARGLSEDLIKRATLEAELSAFNLEELLRSLQGTLPILLSKGMSLDEAFQINRGVAGVAKMTQLTPSQILQETRDLAQGSITSRGSQVAGALGITNADINKYKGDVEGLFNFLMEKFKNYNELLQQYEDTALGRYQQLEERWQTVTKTIVEGVSSQFKGLFEYLINFTGQWVDKMGNRLNALTGKWEDANGNVYNSTKKVFEDAYGNEVFKTPEELANVGKDFSFELNEDLAKVIPVLKDIIDYIAQCVDGFREFVAEEFKGEEPLNIVRDAIKFCIDMFFNLLEVTIDVVHEIVKLAKAIEPVVVGFYNLGTPVAKAIKAVSVGLLHLYYRLIKIAKVLGPIASILMPGGGTASWLMSQVIDDETLDKGLSSTAEEAKALMQESWTANAKSYEDIIGARKSNGDITQKIRASELKDAAEKWTEDYLRQHPEADKTKRPDATEARGVRKAEVDEKARKKAIQEAQKAMKEHIQGLKEQLKDHIAELKETLAKNKIAFDEGFMSIREYYTQKAQIEREEAEARLEEAKAEKAAILATPYEHQADQLKALHTVDREIREYTRAVQKTTQVQKEVANITKAAADRLSDIGNLHDNLFATQMGRDNLLLNAQTTSGMSNTEIVYRQLTQGGLEDNLVRGIIASLMGESGRYLNPTLIGDRGTSYGIAQWHDDRWRGLNNFAKENNSDPSHPLTQAANLLREIWTTESKAFAEVLDYYNKNGKTIEAATYAFTKYFERPADKEGQAQARKDNIKYVNQDLANASNTARNVVSGIGDALTSEINKWLGTPYYLGNDLSRGIDCSKFVQEVYKGFGVEIVRTADEQAKQFNDVGAFHLKGSGYKPKRGDFVSMYFGGDYGVVQGQKIGHTGIYNGDGTITHASSGRGKVVTVPISELEGGIVGYGDLQQFLGKKGLSASSIRLSQANTGETSSEYLKAQNNALKEMRDGLATLESYQLNKIEAQMAKINADLEDKINSSAVQGLEGEAKDKYIQQLVIEARKKSADLIVSVAERTMNYNLTKIDSDFEAWMNKLQLGRVPVEEFGSTLSNYFNYFYNTKGDGGGVNGGIWGVFKQIEAITKQAEEYLAMGMNELYQQAMQKVKSAKQHLMDMINKPIEAIDKVFSGALDLFQTSDKYTNLQQEFGERELKAMQGQLQYNYYSQLESELQSARGLKLDEIEKLKAGLQDVTAQENELLEIDKKLWDTSLAKEKAKLIAEQYPNYLRDLRKTAKQALEDGLVTFLTDGVNEAENLGEALRNLAISFLKEIQQMSAKWMVKSLMNKWFGGWNVDDPNSLHMNPNGIGQTGQQIAVQLTQAGQAVVNALNGVALGINGTRTTTVSASAGVGGGTAPGMIATGTVYSGTAMPILTSPAFGQAKSTYELPALANSQFGSNNQKINFNGMQLSQDSLNQFNQRLQESSTIALPGFTDGLDQVAEGFGEMDLSSTITPNAEQLATSLQSASVSIETASQQPSNIIQSTVVPALQDLGTQARAAGSALSTIGLGGGHAEGGLIKGPGTSTSDSIPAMLSSGEYVIKASSVRKYGTNFLNAVNNGNFTKIKSGVQHFAEGGLVENVARSEINEGMQGFANQQRNNQPINNTAHINVALVRDEAEGFRQLLKSPEGQRIMLDFSRKYASVTSRF